MRTIEGGYSIPRRLRTIRPAILLIRPYIDRKNMKVAIKKPRSEYSDDKKIYIPIPLDRPPERSSGKLDYV